MESGIYVITCLPTEQAYVGTAIHLGKRIAAHINKLSSGKHRNKRLQAAWDQYGASNFSFKILEECEVSALLERERFWVGELGSMLSGFNSAQLGSNGFLRHGQTHSRTYKSWDTMKQRCTNPNSPDYPKYGALGITVCQRWLNSFDAFYVDMGDRPKGHTLDRYPNKSGNYEPTNCRWATPAQQQRNVKSNHYLTVGGKTKLLVDWAREFNMPVDLLRKRTKLGVTGPELFAASYSRFAGIKGADGQTVTTKRKTTPAVIYEAHGKALTLAQWAIELGISESAIKQRLFKYKLPTEEALVAGQRKKGKAGPRLGHHMITAFGKTQSLTGWSQETGIPISTLKNRLYRAKLEPEIALRIKPYAKQRGL
jgi:hypothetical protein